MIINYKVYESFIKKYNIKNDIIKIFNDIDKDIMNHIKFIKYDNIIASNIYKITYDDVLLFECYYDNSTFYKFDHINISYFSKKYKEKTYKEYIEYVKYIINENYNNPVLSYIKKYLQNNCLFFNKEIFNKNIIKYINIDKEILDYYDLYKDILTESNLKQIEYLYNAKNFDLL